MKKLLLICLLLNSILIFAQEKAIGSWTDHLSYSRGKSIVTDGENVYCGTNSGLFVYNTKDNSIQRKNKVNGLTEVEIQLLGYNRYNKVLLIVYKGGGIELLRESGTYTIPFIKNNSTINDKNINQIYFKNELAYLSFSFGVVVINTEKNEIQATYQLGGSTGEININATAIINNYIIVATDNGIYRGNQNNNLLDFTNWDKLNQFSISSIEKMFELADKVYFKIKDANNLDSIYELKDDFKIETKVSLSGQKNKSIQVVEDELIFIDENNMVKIYDANLVQTKSFNIYGDGLSGVTKTKDKLYIMNSFTPLIEYNNDGGYIKNIKPIGPNNNTVFDITVADGIMWTISGGYDFSINNAFNYINLNKYENGKWENYNNYNTPSLANVFDPISVETKPDNPNHLFIGTWSYGLFELKNNLPFIKWDESNSKIKTRQSFANWRGVSDVAFDQEGNLWGVNTHVPFALFTRTVDNNWISYEMTGGEKDVADEDKLTEIVISPGGLKWVAMPLANNILVFDDNGSLQNKNDDRYLILTQERDNGALPGSRGITMEIDKRGQLWVGTSAGLVVNYNPDNIFESDSKDFEEIIVNDGNNNEVVLAGASINDIEVDGANRKWIATEGNGTYLLSEDGKKEILHFTVENSPLISNNIKKIAFDKITGEVYFGTSLGIVSYKSEVIAGSEDFNNVIIYPNPVKSNYEGPIAIKGLMNNTTVKITDINGTLVNEIITEGGQAIWYGTNFNGEKVSSGIYLIFNSAEDELGKLNTQVGKVMLLK